MTLLPQPVVLVLPAGGDGVKVKATARLMV
jgi:hypothetical protein